MNWLIRCGTGSYQKYDEEFTVVSNNDVRIPHNFISDDKRYLT
jgi:hypothetical protein